MGRLPGESIPPTDDEAMARMAEHFGSLGHQEDHAEIGIERTLALKALMESLPPQPRREGRPETARQRKQRRRRLGLE